ncbi:hypothetical protein B0189_07810 [Moraxella cuniculi]|nr:hypothetical protein B0189_07810 [Moraxella cuniculi]
MAWVRPLIPSLIHGELGLFEIASITSWQSCGYVYIGALWYVLGLAAVAKQQGLSIKKQLYLIQLFWCANRWIKILI